MKHQVSTFFHWRDWKTATNPLRTQLRLWRDPPVGRWQLAWIVFQKNQNNRIWQAVLPEELGMEKVIINTSNLRGNLVCFRCQSIILIYFCFCTPIFLPSRSWQQYVTLVVWCINGDWGHQRCAQRWAECVHCFWPCSVLIVRKSCRKCSECCHWKMMKNENCSSSWKSMEDHGGKTM